MAPADLKTSDTITGPVIDKAGLALERIYREQIAFPGSPVTEDLVRLNLDHTARVRENARAIATGDGLGTSLLELAATLHDVAKLDHRESGSGGIDTWHHHYLGAALARKLVLTELDLGGAIADAVAAMIETHSDIPFICDYWHHIYRTGVPAPKSPGQVALRDADVIDMLWVGGIAKIVHLRQVPGSEFFIQDRGDIQNAVASARRSFIDAAGILKSPTAKTIAAGRIATVTGFFNLLDTVAGIDQFDQVYMTYIAGLK